MKIADERRCHASVEHPPLDFGNRRSGLRHVDGDADHVRACLRQLDALAAGPGDIRRVGHRHRLDDDGRTAADLDGAHVHTDRLVKSQQCHQRIDRSYHPAGRGRRCVALPFTCPQNASPCWPGRSTDYRQSTRQRC